MAASDLYPFSTQDGKAVPLEIVKPLSLSYWSTVAATPKSITVPSGKVAWVFCTVDTILRFSGTALPTALVDATNYPDAILIPANMAMIVEITPGAGYLLSAAAGKTYMSVMTQWAGLAQAKQTTTG